MFFLAEPHFAMTIPLLYGYRKNFLTKPISIFANSAIIILFCCISVFFNSGLFLIFLLANVYHVNRQSVGFLKLQAERHIYFFKNL